MTVIGSNTEPQAAISTEAPEDSLSRVLSLLPLDEIIGISQIARALTGTDDYAAIRSAYHQLEHTKTPAYKKGGRWALSLASVRAQRWAEERRAFGGEEQQTLGLLHLLLTNSFALYADAACVRCNRQQLAKLALVSKEAAALIEKLFRDQPDALMPALRGDQAATGRAVTP